MPMNKPDTRRRAPVASVVVPVRNGARVVGASAARSGLLERPVPHVVLVNPA